MMYRFIFVIAIVLSGLNSCQKIIDVDLNESDPAIVIEAELDGNDSIIRVRVSQTASYFDTLPSPLIDNAIVAITDDLGNTTTIPSIGNGEYELLYTPTIGTTYILTVSYNGVIYTASSTMFEAVPQDIIYVEYFPPGPFSGSGAYIPYIQFQDPLNETNYFEIILSKNGKKKDNLKDLNIQDDALTNGNYVKRPLFSVNYDLGDTVGIELRSIDEHVYTYLNQAFGLLSSENSAAPGNPESNWDNDALGYFSAFRSSFQTAIVQ